MSAMASGILLLAAALLAVPGVFVAAKGLSALRRRRIVVQGRAVHGAVAVGAAAALLAYGVAMVFLSAVFAARALR